MIRIQVYITEKTHATLRNLSRETGLSQSELVRQAIDHFYKFYKLQNKLKKLKQAKGLWENHDNLDDFKYIRDFFDRNYKNDE